MRKIGIRFYTRGSATLGSKTLGGRKEPDESYNFSVKKPIPDLVIEVIITSGSIDLLQREYRFVVLLLIAEIAYFRKMELTFANLI